LLIGLLTRRLILPARLILVRHVVSFPQEHRDNGSESAPFRKNKSVNSHCRPSCNIQPDISSRTKTY
jgi:hypothetical protein